MKKSHPFTPDFDSLPGALSVFPLAGCVLLPLAQLQLNIFEPRYLNMVFDALGAGRLIGIAQPNPAVGDGQTLYDTGCVGRITTFSETVDGRLLISLSGVCRFMLAGEIAPVRGYRRFKVDWTPFESDMHEHEIAVDTALLMVILGDFFRVQNIKADMDSLKKMPGAVLVNSLATNLPFPAIDKQSLVEAETLSERMNVLMALAQMSIAERGESGIVRH